MVIKLSNSPNGQVAQPTQPRNTGVSITAHERLEFTVAQANRQHQNALRVDGAAIHFWHRDINKGHPCSCCSSTRAAAVKNILVDKQGGLVTSVPSIATPDTTFVLRDSKQVLSAPEVQALTEKSSNTGWMTNEENDIQIDDFDFDPNELAAQVLGDNDAIPSSAIVCSICKGFGRVGALSLYQGQHVVLDLTEYQTITTSGPTIDAAQKPYRASGQGYIEWTVTLPQYFKSAMKIVARDNTNKSDARLTFIRSTIESDLTPDALQTLQGQNMKDTKVRAYLNPGDTISHIEIAYQLADWPIIAAPIWSAQTDMRYENALVQQQFEFGADIAEVSREDYFWENKNNRLWKITSIDEERRTSTGQRFGYLVTARVVHPYESSNLLSMVSDPAYFHKFSGIDYKQGELSPERISYDHFKTESTNE